MKKCSAIILIFIGLAFYTTYGQTSKFEFGLEGGPSLISLRGNDIIDDLNDPTIGFTGGLFFQYNFNKIIALRTNLAYERKGSIVKQQTYDSSSNSYWDVKTNLNFDYLTLPLLNRAPFGNRVLFFVNTGPYLGYLLKQTYVESGENIPTKTLVATSSFKKFDLGVSAGLGLLVPIKQNLAFSLEARNNLGLYDISATPIINDGSVKTNSTNLLLGIVYKFGARSTVKTKL